LALTMAAALPAQAITITFEELPLGSLPLDTYLNDPAGSGTYWGVSFTGPGLVLPVGDATVPPVEMGTPDWPQALRTPTVVYMNVATGFEGVLSFDYANTVRTTNVTVFSGLGGAGSVVNAVVLPRTTATVASASDPATTYPVFTHVEMGLSGRTAHSVRFVGGTSNTSYIDNITFTPSVPEPEAWGLALAGLSVLAVVVVLGRRPADDSR